MTCRHWLDKMFARSSRARSRRRLSFRPLLETMEERLVPSVNATPDYQLARTSIGFDSGSTPQASGGYTPQQMRQAYGFNQIWFNNGTVQGDGTGQTIAIVDAYDDPNIASDLHVFDQTFGLPDPPSFQKVNETGGTTMPSADAGWGLEESLDVEWAHAIAPGANILLVESNSASDTDLLTAVDTARNTPGVVAVSMSWGGSEFSGQVADDIHFQTPSGHLGGSNGLGGPLLTGGVTFVASSGDAGSGVSWPSSSANVLSVGGTSLLLDGSGNWSSEIGWSGSGGGISAQVTQPAYQQGYVGQSATYRTNPDVAYDAAPGTGVAVYDTQYASANGTGPWIEVGGTSAGAPQWSALIAIADQGRALQGLGSLDGPSQTLPTLYHLPGDFHDITTGDNGPSIYGGAPFYPAGPGYDLVTGLGTPMANRLVPDLVSNATIPANLNIATLNLKDATSGNAITYGSPGETINFSPSVLNWGELAAANATLQVTSGTPGVTVVGSSVLSLGTVNPNQRVQPGGSFQVQLSSSLSDLQQVQLNFTFAYGSGQQQTVSQSFEVVKLQAQTEVQVNFAPGAMLADPTRDIVYIIDKTNLKLLAINTDTGQTVAVANLAAAPSPTSFTDVFDGGQMAVSSDGTRLYVALTDAKEIQVFSLPNLTPLATYSYSFDPVNLAYGANDLLYVSSTDYWGDIRQINALTGAVLGQFQKTPTGYNPYYQEALLRTTPDGKHLYVTETGLMTTGGPNYVYEYDISGTGLPTLLAQIPYQQTYVGDFAVDEGQQQIFTMNGGDYGVELSNTATGDFYTWAFPPDPQSGSPDPYGRAVAELPGSGVVYAGSGGPYDATIARYLADGTFVGSYALQPNTGYTLPNDSLKITPNGALMYVLSQFTGSQNNPYLYRIGIIGSSTLNINENVVTDDLTVVTPQSLTVSENSSGSGNVLTGAVDSEGNTITAIAGTRATAHGSVTIASSGAYTYTPTAGYVGSDSFSFTAQTVDDTTSGTVSITVNAVDDLTVASPSISVNENGSASGNVLTGAVDSEGAAISAVTGTFATAHGSVTIASNGAYTYTPNAGYIGSDSFTFTAQTADDSSSGTVSITVNAVDDLTVLTPSISVNENGSASGNVLTGAVDSESNAITAVAGTTLTAHGSVTIGADGSYTYTPTTGYVGSDSFSFTAQTVDDSTTGTVNVTVGAVDDLTVSSPSLTVNENSSGGGNVLTGAVDSEGGAISAVAGTLTTAHGSVTIASNGNFTYTPTAGYVGSDFFAFTAQTADDSTSGTVNVTVSAVDDLTVMTPQALTVTENSSGGGNVLTGAVDSEGATISAVAGTFSTSHGSVTIASNGAYTYTPTAGYFGTDSFAFTAQTADDSTGGTVNITINQEQSATALSSSANPSVAGQTITLTATVTGSPGTPTGQVTFLDGSTVLGTGTLGGGVATLNASLATAGSHSLTAVYGGDGNFAGSTSAVLTETVNKAGTTVALRSSANPSVHGQAVTFTATISVVSPGSGAPSGSVSFYDGSTLLGTGTVSGGVATFTTSALKVGSHSITAKYGGDSNFSGSTSSALTETVKKASTAVTAGPSSATVNQAVTLTATVSVVSPGTGTPTGTVTFKDTTTSTTLGKVTLTNGSASLSGVIFKTTGQHKISVSYSGDTNNNSTSITLVVTVGTSSATKLLVTNSTQPTTSPKSGSGYLASSQPATSAQVVAWEYLASGLATDHRHKTT
jgi:VCBS repeat-containing protein